MKRLFLGMGSNLGDRRAHLLAGLSRLRDVVSLRVVRCSSVYETEPVGKTDQPSFLNLVLECSSECDARNLMPILREVERGVGRKPRGRWEPRELDIDILYYGDMVIATTSVKVPHPEIPGRRFVLEPLCEIAPTFQEPLRGRRVIDLLRDCAGDEQVKRILDML